MARFLIVITLILSCSSPERQIEQYTYPAEWEPHQAIWMGFELDTSEERFETAILTMVSALTEHVEVNLVVEHDSLIPTMSALGAEFEIDSSRVKFIVQEHSGLYYRDPGPIFLKGKEGDLRIADFLWTGYSNVPVDSISKTDSLIELLDEDIAAQMGLKTVPSRVVMEGGAFDVNGKGTVLLVEAVTLARNPHLTKAEIEEDILHTLGQKKIIWLKSGLAEDPHQVKRLLGTYFGFGTGGHVDEFCRFADDSTILLAWVPESERELNLVNQLNYERMSDNLEILINATDQAGNRFRVVRVPIPEFQYMEAKITQVEYDFLKSSMPELTLDDTIRWVAASSYLNVVITNGLVLLPAYWQEDMDESFRIKDDQVLEIFKRQFPNRQIVQINPIMLNYWGGGMHCLTQQQPMSSK